MGQGPSAPASRRGQYEELHERNTEPSGGGAPAQLSDPSTGQPALAPVATRQAASSIPTGGAAQAGSAAATSTATLAGAAGASSTQGAAGTTTAQAASAPTSGAASSSQPPQRSSHKSTTLIPSWSRSLSSQALQLECQKVSQPQRSVSPRDIYAVLDLEVMKFVAYCGGVTIRLRVDELAPGATDTVTWGLASTRACPALVHAQLQAGQTAQAGTSSGTGNEACKTPTKQSGASSAVTASPPAGTSGKGGPVLPGMPVDSTSRKPLHIICATSTVKQIAVGDILTIELAPREDKQPVIMAMLKLNNVVLLQSSLPCSTISSLQIFPFVTVHPGMHVSLHEAVTPSPLFTWYAPSPAAVGVAETQLCELDTCTKYHSTPTTPITLSNGMGTAVELRGATVFRSGRHRWTVQLDNYSAQPTHMYVGVCTSAMDQGPVTNGSGSNVLSNFSGPLRSLTAGTSVSGTAMEAGILPAVVPTTASSSSAAAAVAAVPASTAAGPSGSSPGTIQSGMAAASSTIGNATAEASTSDADATTAVSAFVNAVAATAAAGVTAPASIARWGAWIKLPGSNPANNLLASNPYAPPPPREGFSHAVESTSAHCFITVDLDLTAGYVRFFRNGHLIVSAFTGLSGPVSPVVCFVQAPSLSCQAGLVNLTKLRQLDLTWSAEKCSGDLKLAGMAVSKVSEVFGDYSTVLASQGFINGVHLWLVKINNLSEPDSIFIGLCRGCMPLDLDPQDLRDRTYYLSNGVIRVGGRRVATNAANFTKGDIVGVVLDADQGEIVFFRNGMEQGRARGIRGRLYPFISCDSEGDQVTLLGSYTVLLNRIPRNLADMEWDTLRHGADIELSSNCLTAFKTASTKPSTVCGTILYSGGGTHEFHVILDTLGPDGVWVGVGPFDMDPDSCVGDVGCGWALHSDGDRRFDGKEDEFAQPFKNGDVLTVTVDLTAGTLSFARNGVALGLAFSGITGSLVSAVTLASEETKVTIQNRPTVLTGEYTGELRWDEARAGKDLHVIDGLTITKTSNEGGDYATVLGTLCLASGQHSWNLYINHVEDSNLFIGVAIGGHDLNADPQEMKHRTYYLSNGTIRVAGKLITRCAEPYAEGDLITVQLDMEVRRVAFLKNGVLQGAGDGLPDEVWPYLSLDNIMDSITLHSSNMFIDLAHSLRWNPARASRNCALSADGHSVTMRLPGAAATAATRAGPRDDVSAGGSVTEEVPVLASCPSPAASGSLTEVEACASSGPVVPPSDPEVPSSSTVPVAACAPAGTSSGSAVAVAAAPVEEVTGQATVLGLREYSKAEVHSWIVRFEQSAALSPTNFLVGVAPPGMDLHRSLGEEGCGVGVDYYGYWYVNGRYFHSNNLSHWAQMAKPVRGSTAKHKGRAAPVFTFVEGRCEVTLTLDLKEGTLKLSHGGRTLGTIAGVKGPLHAAVTITSSRQMACLAPGPIGKAEHTNEELVSVLKAKGFSFSPRMEAALLLVPRDLFVPRDRHREAFRDQKVTVRMADGSSMTLPPPSFVAAALERLGLSPTTASFLDVGCGTGYVTALAACLMGHSSGMVHGIECVSSRLEGARSNLKQLRERLGAIAMPPDGPLGDPLRSLQGVELSLSNVLIPECTDGITYGAIYCDASISEEDLPTFLSLLKPGGKMVVVIDEEALFISRSADPHDFTRESVTHLTGDYGDLEDPTPWEVQEAILRIKDRERRRGADAARAEMTSLRSFEYAEMQQRVTAAMSRINELEAAARSAGAADVVAAASAAANGMMAGLAGSPAGVRGSMPHLHHLTSLNLRDSATFPRSPLRVASHASTDDVRVVVKDKSRRSLHLKSSPRSSLDTLPAGEDRKEPPMRRSSKDREAPLGTTSDTEPTSAGSLRMKDKVSSDQLLSMASGQDADDNTDAGTDAGSRADDAVLSDFEDGRCGSPYPYIAGMLGTPGSGMGGMQASEYVPMGSLTRHVSMPQTTFDDLIDAMSVQTFSVDQVEVMIRGASPQMVDGRDVFQGTFKGVKVRVWRVAVGHSISYLELRRAYSKYCISHPNITSVLGVCIQHPELQQAQQQQAAVQQQQQQQAPAGAPGSGLSHSMSMLASAPSAAAMATALLRDPDAWSLLRRLRVHDSPMERSQSQAPGTPTQTGYANGSTGRSTLWVVEECFGDESLHNRLERGLLSWQQVSKTATDLCKALAFLQDLKQSAGLQQGLGDSGQADTATSDHSHGCEFTGALPSVLSPYALKTVVMPSNVQVDAQSTKISMLPILLSHLESVVSALEPTVGSIGYGSGQQPPATPFHADMAYSDPNALYADDDGSMPSFYAYGVVLLQLLTEQGALGLLSAVKEALGNSTLLNLIPRMPTSGEITTWAEELASLAIRCTQPGGINSLEREVLPVLHTLHGKLSALGSSAMSWEQVEEMLMLPLQPRVGSGPGAGAGSGGSRLDSTGARRWVRQDFRMRRKLFLAEVAKLAVEGPVHKLEIRRSRCFKDSVTVFAGKGHAVWRQPLKVTFVGEAGMDSGGVTREWFSTLSSAISRGSPDLFWSAGPQKNQLYINPLSSSPSHLKKFAFVGLFMAKAILETAARKELGPIALCLNFCEPFWKLLLGAPLSLVDLAQLDPTEFRSLMTLLSMDIDGLIFETFTWSFQPSAPLPGMGNASSAARVLPFAALPQPGDPESTTPKADAAALAASPFACDPDDMVANSIALKPGGKHIKVSNHNKREYVLLKAHKMLVGAVEAQMGALMDAFHSVLPRELLDKYAFSSTELALLVCGEQRVDTADLKRHCKYEDGYNGNEDTITWLWEAVESFDDDQRRALLQFWSGSDGMPAEGFGALDPAFHVVPVERLYDAADTTARLPAAHTCFRQLDLPRYRSKEELREKLMCAITIGQGYMALS